MSSSSGTSAYLTYEGKLSDYLWPLRLSVSVQVQHERQRLDDPSVLVQRIGTDEVLTLGFVAAARTRPILLHRRVSLSLHYGLDQYTDWISSEAYRTFTDLNQTAKQSRGQYLDGSSYSAGGVYADGALSLPKSVTVFGGVRLSYAVARAPARESVGESGGEPELAAGDGSWRSGVEAAKSVVPAAQCRPLLSCRELE
jgi:hypothetical protein